MKKSVALVAAMATFGFANSAGAADIPVKAPVYTAAPVAVYDWTGLYVGGNIGYGWGRNSDPGFSFVDAPGLGLTAYVAAGGNVTPNVQPKGVIGGVQIGYNWMFSPNMVAGVVTDFQASGVTASRANTVTPPGGVTSTQSNSVETDWFGTVRGKLGWAQNNWLLYATGGLAYGHVKTSGTASFVSVPPVTYTGSNTTTKAGWALGAGVDYGVMRNWSLGLEYLYVDLGRVSYTETPNLFPTSTITISNRAAMHIARLTANYKF